MPNDDSFEILIGQGEGTITLVRGAKRRMVMQMAKSQANSRRTTVIVKNSRTGETEEVPPEYPTK